MKFEKSMNPELPSAPVFLIERSAQDCLSCRRDGSVTFCTRPLSGLVG